MLKSTPDTPLSEFDLAVFQVVVPQDHYLRKVMACINFEAFRPRLIRSYDPDFGRPAIDPVRMLKILFLRFHYRLSDRQVMERTVTDMAFRWFVSLGMHAEIPNHTNGTHFRHRLGAESFQQVFQDLVTQARAHGLVSDRLPLKDATHLFADVAKVGPLPLVAQVRGALVAGGGTVVRRVGPSRTSLVCDVAANHQNVPFVEVGFGNFAGSPFGWDTHTQNFTAVQGLSGILNAAWGTLMDDLRDRGLLQSTLIVWMGEFGRTPRINNNQGRDHYPNAWTTVLAGGGIRGGRVFGRTSADGTTIEGERPVTVPDFLATVCRALGVDPSTQNMSNEGRPIRIAEPTARPVNEIIA